MESQYDEGFKAGMKFSNLESARELYSMIKEVEKLKGNDLAKYFGQTNMHDLINKLDVEEFYQLYKRYKEDKAIRVGDVVYAPRADIEVVVTRVVTTAGNDFVDGFSADGCVFQFDIDEVKKTDEHFDMRFWLKTV